MLAATIKILGADLLLLSTQLATRFFQLVGDVKDEVVETRILPKTTIEEVEGGNSHAFSAIQKVDLKDY